MIPGQLTHLCRFYHSVGFSTGHIELYQADDLTPSSRRHVEDGEVIDRVIIPFDTLAGMVATGEIVDSKTIIAVLWRLRTRSGR